MSDLDSFEAPHNTQAARMARINAPEWADGMTFPSDVPAPIISWALRAGNPQRLPPGLVLHGPAGVWKTGLGVCALRALAELGFGSKFFWNMVTGPGLQDAIERGWAPYLPSPCWFVSWSQLVSTEKSSMFYKPGAETPLSYWLDHLYGRVSALMLDDVDVDAGTQFRESLLLQHMEWAVAGRRRALILTCNSSPEHWPDMFGERIARRLVDDKMFSRVEMLEPLR